MKLIKKEVIILVGNIGSGKSTYSKKYQKRGYVIVSRDQLRYSIGGGKYIFNESYEPIIWRIELSLFRYFVDFGANIVVDEVNVNKIMRYRYISYAKRNGYRVVFIVMPRISMKKSVNRRMRNPHGTPNRGCWREVWEKLDGLYEKPSKKEGVDKIIWIKK